MEEIKTLLRSHIAITAKLAAREEALLEEHAKLLLDHEKRLRIIERVIAYGTGAIGLGLYAIKTFVK